MDDAFAACAFFLLKRAFVKAHECIFLKLGTFRAQFAVGFVVTFAVYLYHITYGFFLPFHSFVFWVRWLRLQVNQLKTNKLAYSHKGLPWNVRVILTKIV